MSEEKGKEKEKKTTGREILKALVVGFTGFIFFIGMTGIEVGMDQNDPSKIESGWAVIVLGAIIVVIELAVYIFYRAARERGRLRKPVLPPPPPFLSATLAEKKGCSLAFSE